MTRHLTNCITISCNGCGAKLLSGEEEFVVHFTDEPASQPGILEALSNLNWIEEGTEHYCEQCSCERSGHALVEKWQFRGSETRSCKCGDRVERDMVGT